MVSPHLRVCPHCKEAAPSRPVGFTWWGGLIGAKLIHHVECESCHGRYNGRTGALNTTAIAIYIIAISVIAFGVAFMAFKH